MSKLAHSGKSVHQAIEYYLPLKRDGKMSMSQIKEELKADWELNEDDINYVCREVASLELESLQDEKEYLGFLKHIGFSWFFLIVAMVMIGFSIFYLYYGYINEVLSKAPYFILAAGLILFIKHIVRLIKYKRSEARKEKIKEEIL